MSLFSNKVQRMHFWFPQWLKNPRLRLGVSLHHLGNRKCILQCWELAAAFGNAVANAVADKVCGGKNHVKNCRRKFFSQVKRTIVFGN